MVLVAAILLAVFVVGLPWGLAIVAGGALFEVVDTAFWIRRSRRRRPQAGAEALVGATATVVEPCRPEGKVRVHGELWRARCQEGAAAGERVVVEGLDGLTLRVRPSGR